MQRKPTQASSCHVVYSREQCVIFISVPDARFCLKDITPSISLPSLMSATTMSPVPTMSPSMEHALDHSVACTGDCEALPESPRARAPIIAPAEPPKIKEQYAAAVAARKQVPKRLRTSLPSSTMLNDVCDP